MCIVIYHVGWSGTKMDLEKIAIRKKAQNLFKIKNRNST